MVAVCQDSPFLYFLSHGDMNLSSCDSCSDGRNSLKLYQQDFCLKLSGSDNLTTMMKKELTHTDIKRTVIPLPGLPGEASGYCSFWDVFHQTLSHQVKWPLSDTGVLKCSLSQTL